MICENLLRLLNFSKHCFLLRRILDSLNGRALFHLNKSRLSIQNEATDNFTLATTLNEQTMRLCGLPRKSWNIALDKKNYFVTQKILQCHTAHNHIAVPTYKVSSVKYVWIIQLFSPVKRLQGLNILVKRHLGISIFNEYLMELIFHCCKPNL